MSKQTEREALEKYYAEMKIETLMHHIVNNDGSITDVTAISQARDKIKSTMLTDNLKIKCKNSWCNKEANPPLQVCQIYCYDTSNDGDGPQKPGSKPKPRAPMKGGNYGRRAKREKK